MAEAGGLTVCFGFADTFEEADVFSTNGAAAHATMVKQSMTPKVPVLIITDINRPSDTDHQPAGRWNLLVIETEYAQHMLKNYTGCLCEAQTALGFTKIKTLELGIPIMKKELFFPNRPIPVLADNDIRNPLSL